MRSLLFIFVFISTQAAWAQTTIFSGPVFGSIRKDQISRRVSQEPSSSARWEAISGTGEFMINQASDSFMGGGMAYKYERYDVPVLSRNGWANIGVYPTRQTKVVSIRRHQNSEAGLLPWPNSRDSFAQWRVGDSLHWRRENGVGVFLGLGVGVISIGPVGDSFKAGARLLLGGSFQVFMEKRAHNQLYLEVRPGTVRTASMLGDVIVLYGEAGLRIENFRHGIGLLIDPTTATGVEAFDMVMQGRMQETEQYVARVTTDGNRVVSHLNQKRSIGYGQWGLQTPVVPVFSLARRSETSDTESSVEDETGNVVTSREAESLRLRTGRVISRYTSELRGVRVFRDSTGEALISWRWDWESNKANPGRLQRALGRLRDRLKCGQTCEFDTHGITAHKAYARASATWSVRLADFLTATRQSRAYRGLSQAAAECLRNDLQKDCMRAITRGIIDLKDPLRALFAESRQCVSFAFNVGGEFMKLWQTSGQVCPSLHDNLSYRAQLEYDTKGLLELDLAQGAYPRLEVDPAVFNYLGQ